MANIMTCIKNFTNNNWNTGRNAGFTNGNPWLPVHDDYPTLNALTEAGNPASVLFWYRKLGKFRRSHKELTAGAYEELLPEDEQIFAFARTLGNRRLVTVANFSLREAALPRGFADNKTRVMGSEPGGDDRSLRPLEARIYRER